MRNARTYAATIAAGLAVTALAAGWLATASAAEASDVRLAPVTADVPVDAAALATDEDIVEVAAKAGSFETLLAAAEAAGLVETLKGEGPLTVFAPTDEAFAALPEGTVPALLEDRKRLRSVLTYHVIAGEVTAERVVELDSAETVNGRSVRIRVDDDGTVRIDDARVVTADVKASNGVIHVIDRVLIPGSSD